MYYIHSIANESDHLISWDFRTANAPSPYFPSTPGQIMTHGSASYLPGTPGGQPMTPGTRGLDIMCPIGMRASLLLKISYHGIGIASS